MYDDPRLHGVFLSRLGNPRRPFKLELMVDRQAAAGEGGRKYMRPRLRELKTAGAQVWLCDGHNHTEILGTGAGNLHGHVHVKGVVVDRRVAYTGSMNLTRAARTNREIMFKIRGPPVVQFLNICLAFVITEPRCNWDFSEACTWPFTAVIGRCMSVFASGL